MVAGVTSVDRETGDDDARFIVCSLFVKNVIYRILCFVKKYVDRFRSGSVYELYCLKACILSKARARSLEITNEQHHS